MLCVRAWERYIYIYHCSLLQYFYIPVISSTASLSYGLYFCNNPRASSSAGTYHIGLFLPRTQEEEWKRSTIKTLLKYHPYLLLFLQTTSIFLPKHIQIHNNYNILFTEVATTYNSLNWNLWQENQRWFKSCHHKSLH